MRPCSSDTAHTTPALLLMMISASPTCLPHPEGGKYVKTRHDSYTHVDQSMFDLATPPLSASPLITPPDHATLDVTGSNHAYLTLSQSVASLTPAQPRSAVSVPPNCSSRPLSHASRERLSPATPARPRSLSLFSRSITSLSLRYHDSFFITR